MDTISTASVDETGYDGYDAAAAARVFGEFLEYHRGHDSFWAWLNSYPAHQSEESPDPEVEIEIDRAILALLAFQHGTRTWPQVHQELHDARIHLIGLARYPAPAR